VEANPCGAEDVGPVGPPDFDLSRAPVLDCLPAAVNVECLEGPWDSAEDPDSDAADHSAQLPDEARYGWIRRDGIRASWGSTIQWQDTIRTREDVRRVADALGRSGTNVFWGISNCQAVGGLGHTEAERERVLERWAWTASALEGTGVRWYPTLDYRYFREEKTRCYGAQGQQLDAPSPMDLGFWRDNWRGSLLAIAEFSLDHPSVGGIALDLELYAHPPAYNYYTGYGFEDACFHTVLRDWEGKVAEGLLAEAADLQLPERYDWLRTHALLEAYFARLSDRVESICREIRDAVWDVNPELLFASYIFTTPCSPFDLGVYRGFSTSRRPIILMTFNVRSARMLAYLRRERVYAYHASVALLGMIERQDYATVLGNAAKFGHGYWVNNINALLHGDPESIESPARQGIGPEEAMELLKGKGRRAVKRQT